MRPFAIDPSMEVAPDSTADFWSSSRNEAPRVRIGEAMTTFEGGTVEIALATRTRRISLEAIKRCPIAPGPSVEKLVEQSLLSDAVQFVLNDLPTERREVIALSFGLADHSGVNRGSYTIDEIARVLKISRERVAAVRATTLMRLRRQRKTLRLLAPFKHLLPGEIQSCSMIVVRD